ncbi:MAG TPA: hypothetical protein VGE15_00270 [Sphingobacteriaceae bacterium]
MSDKELDQLFQSRFDSFEAEPAASLWSSIESQLENKPGKRAGMPVFWMAAASVVVLLGAGLWLFRPEEKVYLKGETVLAKVHQQPAEEIPAGTPAISTQPAAETEPAESNPVRKAVRVKKDEYLAAADTREKEPAVQAVPENQVLFAKAEEPVAENDPAPIMALVAAEEAPHSRRGEVHQTVLAMLPPEEEAVGEKPLRERRKIRSVGDIVNFVVAKVDQRDDKLIEMAEDDEGTKISGINLGLFKIKSKKR